MCMVFRGTSSTLPRNDVLELAHEKNLNTATLLLILCSRDTLPAKAASSAEKSSLAISRKAPSLDWLLVFYDRIVS